MAAAQTVRQSGLPTREGRRFEPVFTWVTPRFAAALLIVAALVASAAFAPPMLLVAALAGAALIGFSVADSVLGPDHRGVTVSREPLDHLALRTPAELRYAVMNRTSMPVRFGIIDTPVDNLEFPEAPVTGTVGPQRRRIAVLPVIPRERGNRTLGALYVWLENPIGLLRRRLVIDAPAQARVFPDLSAVERYGALARRGRLIEAGFRKLRLRGAGGEFDSLREYTPDDEFRAINWKATARRGKLMVEQFDIERSQTVMLVLDAGRLMTPRLGLQRKFDYAVTAALSVASIASLADDKVGLMAFAGDVLEHVAPRSGTRHASGLAQRLYDLQPRFEESDYAGAIAYLRRRQPKRSLVIFFTDMFDPVASAAVLSNVGVLSPRHLVICVLMNDEAIENALAAQPKTAEDAYRASVAASLLVERRTATAILGQRGVAVLDVPAAQLTVSLINAYIEVKSRNLL